MSQMRNRILILLVAVVAIGGVLFATQKHTVPGIKAAFDAEFLTRPDGYLGLSEKYGFKFANEPDQMDPGLMYRAAADGAVDVICAYATDGRIPAYELFVLEDDKKFFPPYYAAPLVRADTLQEHPELESILNTLGGKLSDQIMQQLNYRVDEKGEKPYDVAKDYLIKENYISKDSKPGNGSAGRVVIGGKPFTEQEILGEMLGILIEHKSDIRAERKLNLGGTMICFNALKSGDIDLYAEYTGTGLMNILKHELISDPDEAYDVVKTDFAKKWDLIWLEPFGFNNTYTLTMRKEHADELGIKSISDLAKIVNRQQGIE